ncbi:hypothetical protein ACN20G_28120 (plasmid) [Streptomyces sp. BI20]|uniref:hypothetical protein n=1 Tax=Streptomyces sp. BI20 TaxID=3403460 RepID=UPI003C78438E
MNLTQDGRDARIRPVAPLHIDELPVDLFTVRQTLGTARGLGLLGPRNSIDDTTHLLLGHLRLLLSENLGDEYALRELYRDAYALISWQQVITPHTPTMGAWKQMRQLADVTERCARLWAIHHPGQAGGGE